MAEYLLDVVEEAHVEHLVRFVENHCMHVGKIHLLTFYEVDEAPRGGHDHLHTVAQGADLALDARSAVDRQYLYLRDIFGIVREVARYLQAEFPRGGYYQRLGHIAPGVYALQHGESERRGLACAGLRQANDVALFIEKVRNHHLLYWHGEFEPHLLYGFEQPRLHAELLECLCCLVFTHMVIYVCRNADGIY